MKGRLAGLGAVLLIGAGTVAGAQAWRPAPPAGSAVPAPSGAQVSLPATGLGAVPVCPGPQTLVVPDGGTALAPTGPVVVGAVVQSPDTTSDARSSTGATRRTAPATLAGTALSPGEGGIGLLTLTRTSQAGPVPLQAPRAAAAPPMSAVQLGLSRVGDQRGLSALACATAATQTWLVGGGTQAGRRGQIVLTNPAATPAKVDVTVHGPDGPVESPSGTGVVVPAENQVALRLDALAPDLDATAVVVRARSGRVSASLHDSWVRGTTPGGVDDVIAAAPPARRQIVPGVSIAPPKGATLPTSATEPGAVAVRVVNPGTDEVVVRVRLLGEAGEAGLPDGVLSIGAGEVRDLALTTVDAGLYTAVVEADGPVVAAAVVGRTSPGGQAAGTPAAVGGNVPPSEFGWAASVQPLAGTTLVALPRIAESGGKVANVASVLELAAADATGSVEVVELDGEGHELAATTVLVTSASGAERALSSKAAAVRLTPVKGGGPLAAAVVLTASDAGGPMIAVLPVRPGPTGVGARPHVVADVRVGLRA